MGYTVFMESASVKQGSDENNFIYRFCMLFYLSDQGGFNGMWEQVRSKVVFPEIFQESLGTRQHKIIVAKSLDIIAVIWSTAVPDKQPDRFDLFPDLFDKGFTKIYTVLDKQDFRPVCFKLFQKQLLTSKVKAMFFGP